MKVVLVHDWLFHMRGGEKVLDAISELFPEAEIHTLFYDKRLLSASLKTRKIHGSILQYFPGIRRYYRWLLPLFPLIIKSIRLKDADLVISTSHCVAKAVRIPAGAVHICYCHTPMRYIWGFGEVYFRTMPGPMRVLVDWITSGLRKWDIEQNKTVDFFLANSENVRRRIQNYYHREAVVIHPPLDAEFYKPCAEKKDFYLVVSAFVPYKRVDIVIEAFNKLERKLLIVGSGPLADEYRRLRSNPNIMFLGGIPDEQLRTLYSEAKAVIFPTEEDFGIVPLEAQACGTPVLAFNKGGALESVKSGLFFDEQTPEAVRDAVERFEAGPPVDPALVSSLVQDFSRQKFKERFVHYVAEHSRGSGPHGIQVVQTIS